LTGSNPRIIIECTLLEHWTLFLRCVNEESTLEELRIGFVGCGAMGQELLGAAAKNASASIAAVCDLSLIHISEPTRPY